MNSDTAIIDRIVAGVLTQLAADGRGVTTETRRQGEDVGNDLAPSGARGHRTFISANVVTAEIVNESISNGNPLVVGDRAIVTPAAWDIAREKGIEITRADSGLAAHLKCAAKPESTSVATLPLMIVVRNTDSVDRLWDNMRTAWRRELLGCPDDAASLATSAVCRGESSTVVILAEQIHRAACLANRKEKVKAVAISDASDVRTVKKQLRANVWCLDPSNRSWFELRNTLRAITEN